MKNKLYGSFTTAILRSFLTAIIIYTVVLVIAFYVSLTYLSRYIWYGTELFYPLLSWINDNRMLFSIVCWLVGFLVIFFIYWRKLLGYIAEIVDAGGQLVSQDNSLIRLPGALKQIEDKMNEAKQSAIHNLRLAKEAEQRKNDLIVYLAHDLKTPLTSVIGYLSLLYESPEIPEELQKKYLSIALTKSNRLEDLINEFFEITRFNLQNIDLETGKVNLSMMLRQLMDEFYPLFAEKRLSFTANIDDGLFITADSGKLARVFDNILRNAVNYSYMDSEIFLSASDKSDSVLVTIRNAGDRIPPQKLDRIFEQFFRLDSARTSSTGGAGLGLAIAKQIVELHRGSISVTSNDQFTEFSVSMPKS